MLEPKLFTVEEAHQLLPNIRQCLRQLRTLREAMATHQKQIDVERVTGASPATMHGLFRDLHQAGAHFYGHMEQLYLLGIELKDLDTGLVDFYSKRDGHIVYLCWKDGEDTISFWHPLEGGFAGRRPIEPGS